MDKERLREYVRHFRENGLKMLPQHPGNAHDLLALAGTTLLDRIDFTRMTVDPTTYIASDYRHVAFDLVLRAPFRTRMGRRARRWITVYILLEHQSEPDPLMLLRVLDYLVQMWKAQLRAWLQRHDSPAGFRQQPILPLVFYTGTRTWDGLGRLVDLIEAGELFADVTPEYRPLFVSLPTLPAASLESEGGAMGWVLELVQQRGARPEEFDDLVRRVTRHLEATARVDQNRWQELLSYIGAMVYHDRESSEHGRLIEVIESSVRSEERQWEVRTMGQTMAEVLREEGEKRGEMRARREILKRHLHQQFGKVPRRVEKTVDATNDIARLDAWIDSVRTAVTLDEVGIPPTR